MTSWEDKPYWVAADDIAYDAYRQLFSQIVVRGSNYFSKCIPRDYNFSNLFRLLIIFENEVSIESLVVSISIKLI